MPAQRRPATVAAFAAIASSRDSDLLDTLTDASRTPAEKNAAMQALLERYWGLLLLAAQQVLANEHDAEDVAQEVVALLLQGLGDNFDPLRGNLGTFLQTVARNRARDHGRRKSRQARLRERAARHHNGRVDADLLDELIHQEDEGRLRAYVRRHLAELPAEELPLLLTAQHFDELSCQEIADCFGLPLPVVYRRLHRARTILRERMAEDGGPPRR
jgi:RNA polymerase sigma-70 factor, ECF subfamily